MGASRTDLHLVSPGYPASVRRYLAEHAPATIFTLGSLGALNGKKLALFCSVRCPGTLILETYHLAQVLREAGVTVIGGFHSPMEKECLRLLLRGSQPVVVCPARGLSEMRMPSDWQKPLAAGRLLILSPFDDKIRRPTADLAQVRNAFVAALADAVFIAYAEAGGKTAAFARDVLGWGKPVFTFGVRENEALTQLGARAVREEMWASWR